jgi:hypothetical protein
MKSWRKLSTASCSGVVPWRRAASTNGPSISAGKVIVVIKHLGSNHSIASGYRQTMELTAKKIGIAFCISPTA